ncbi:MAG: molybdopterin dehydrogenase [Deltaproteobacteria bacterium RIFCSPLOWO2_02_FULL_57_26]|nr:MAG: molybdopterin dehydrogenase [Deltaproteobacteria bacterium RIFCSPLOWO2_02_FULL_57_26]OGQ75731.1 MAG: molybdopterin dehydrogenase [Deltaproteobacteria bacterium RIFCSPLOWO2_12_FULL_57_22]
MKPAPFEYFAPQAIDEALKLLQKYGEEAKVLAGGQSLMPLLSLRLARPAVIIDINRLRDLAFIRSEPDGGLRIGALARQRAVERSGQVATQCPLIAAAMPLIGHFQIRNRGTIGGSLAHADPAAELPAVSLTLEAEFVVRSTRGERAIAAKDFFLGYMTTAIEPSELLTEIRIPATRPRVGWAIEEVARRRGDFAMVGVVTLVELNGNDTCQNSRIVVFGAGEKPERVARAERLLCGKRTDEHALAEVAKAVTEDLDPVSDVHASAEYRKEVGGVLTRRALQNAFKRAQKETA